VHCARLQLVRTTKFHERCLCACSFYNESIPGNVLCERIASYKHLFNLYWYTR
jgi:hypothetical protein